jgi:DNA processing protein
MGTLITQAGEKSGALSTASFALGQGKDIFCISPHELYSDTYSGVTGLIRDGAIPVFDARDVLNEYYSVYAHKLNHNSLILRQKSREGIFSENAKKPVKASKQSAPEKEVQPKQPQENVNNSGSIPKVKVINTDGMSEEKKKIIEFVSGSGAVHFDDIASFADWSEDVETMLTDLELDGYIKSLSGNRYTI